MEYTLVFIQRGDKVLMIRKNRPSWQVGKLNFIGGKIEKGETPAAGAVREVWEETGLNVTVIFRGMLYFDQGAIHIYEAVTIDGKPQSMTDEEVLWVDMDYASTVKDEFSAENTPLITTLIRGGRGIFSITCQENGYLVEPLTLST